MLILTFTHLIKHCASNPMTAGCPKSIKLDNESLLGFAVCIAGQMLLYDGSSGGNGCRPRNSSRKGTNPKADPHPFPRTSQVKNKYVKNTGKVRQRYCKSTGKVQQKYVKLSFCVAVLRERQKNKE